MRRQPSRYPFPTIIFTADFIPGFFEVRYSSTDLLEKSGNLPNTKKRKVVDLPERTKMVPDIGPETDYCKAIKSRSNNNGLIGELVRFFGHAQGSGGTATLVPPCLRTSTDVGVFILRGRIRESDLFVPSPQTQGKAVGWNKRSGSTKRSREEHQSFQPVLLFTQPKSQKMPRDTPDSSEICFPGLFSNTE